MQFLKENWVALLFGLLGFIEVIVRITPTEKDNTVLEYIKKLLSVFIPNRKKYGGTF